MIALPTIALSLLTLEMVCDERQCYPVLVLPAEMPTVQPKDRPPLVHLHPIEVPTEVRPWKPKTKPPGEKK
jgi:hypothetical protein